MAAVVVTLDQALATLLVRSGARAIRVVDGAGHVIAALPPASTAPDDPGTVARLVRAAGALGAGALGAGALGAGVLGAGALGSGSLDDVLVTTGRALHLLRPTGAPGAFLLLTLDLRADAATARRALADPALHDVVAAALALGRVPRNAADGRGDGARRPEAASARVPAGTPSGRVPRNAAVPRDAATAWPEPAQARSRVPRNAPDPLGEAMARSDVPPPRVPRNAPLTESVPAPRREPTPDPVPPARQPALTALVTDPPRFGDGALAVEALTRLAHPAPTPREHVPPPPHPLLPRRRPAAAPGTAPAAGLPDRAWARDVDTMRRILAGLRRLS